MPRPGCWGTWTSRPSPAGWPTGHYPARRYPAVFIGSANGAAVHLCAAAGIPWLPQTMLVPVRRHRNKPDHATDAMEFGRRVAPALLRAHPGVSLHHMHDGNQDRLMISHMAYFRLKLQRLGPAYRAWLATHLAGSTSDPARGRLALAGDPRRRAARLPNRRPMRPEARRNTCTAAHA